MKKPFSLLSVLFIALQLNAQITLEHTYNTPFIDFNLLKLEYSGYKYYSYGNGLSLYNLDHTLFRQLTLPTLPSNSRNVKVGFITEALFDSDTSDIEYLLTYSDDGISPSNMVYYTRVCEENGNIIFSKDSVTGWMSSNHKIDYLGPANATIYNTNEGAKMFLSRGFFYYDVSVYSLPGLLECNVCDGERAVPLRIDPNFEDSGFKVYPNPSDSYSVVEYELAPGVDKAQLIIYDVQGKETGRYSVNRANRQLLVPTSGLSSGSYYYIFEQSGKALSNKVIIRH